jgi:uncharacterized protein YigE (DUF2233 family)
MSFKTVLAAVVIASTLSAASEPARAECSTVSVDANVFTVCSFEPSLARIETFSLDDNGKPIGGFAALEQLLSMRGEKLIFAMNAGMFGADLKPIGLYVEDRKLQKKLNRRAGSGNFHLKPNGVFFVIDGKAEVMETESFARLSLVPDYATQSGPMLTIEGALHPKFSATGTSEKIRNGVGVKADGTVVFAISETLVTFHEFALLFRDALDCPNALFLDGSVSSLFSEELNRNDGFVPLGPMVGVVKKQ